MTIQLSITNHSGSTLDDFWLVHLNLPQLQWVSGTDGCFAIDAQQGSCGLTSLAAGRTAEVEVVARVLSTPVPVVPVSVSANTAPGSRNPYSGRIDQAGQTVTTVITIRDQ